MARYRLEIREVESRLLEGNPLGDPHRRKLRLLVPESMTGPLPVVWILAAYGGTAAALVEEDPWSENLLDRVNRLADEGRLGDAIFALPDCFTLLGGSQYLDSPAQGPYQRHLWEELCPAVEEAYPTSGKHGVAGRSSGGYGAFVQAAARPEKVRAIACHAGDMAFELVYPAGFAALAQALDQHGGVENFLAAFRASSKKRSGPWFMAVQTLCMAACYSPSAAAPAGIDLPFDPHTLALREEVWARWLDHDPLRMIERTEVQDALRGLDLLFFDCGSRDEYALQYGQRRLVRRLDELGIAHEAEEFDDGHRSTSYRFDVSLPKIVQALS